MLFGTNSSAPPSKQQLYGHLHPIQIKRTSHAEHCWRNKDEHIGNFFSWNLTLGHSKYNLLIIIWKELYLLSSDFILLIKRNDYICIRILAASKECLELYHCQVFSSYEVSIKMTPYSFRSINLIFMCITVCLFIKPSVCLSICHFFAESWRETTVTVDKLNVRSEQNCRWSHQVQVQGGNTTR